MLGAIVIAVAVLAGALLIKATLNEIVDEVRAWRVFLLNRDKGNG